MSRPALFAGILGRRDEGRHAASSPREPASLPPAPTAEQEDTATREREIIAAHRPCRTAPNGTGARCTCDFNCVNYWLRAARSRNITWIPKPGRHAAPAAPTAPMPVVDAGFSAVAPARPYAPQVQGSSPLSPGTPVWPGVRPVIGDAMDAAFPPPPPPPPPAPESAALPYTQDGWAGLQMRRWIERGEWERADAALPAAYERNAADMAVALVRSRARIADALTLGCAGLGLPGLAPVLWQRASELTAAALATAGTGGAR